VTGTYDRKGTVVDDFVLVFDKRCSDATSNCFQSVSSNSRVKARDSWKKLIDNVPNSVILVVRIDIGSVEDLIFDSVRLVFIASVNQCDFMSRIVELWIGHVVDERLLFVFATLKG